MTSRERVLAALSGRPVDRIPCGPMMMDIGAVALDIPVGRYATDADLLARSQLALHERIGQDVIFLGCDNYYIAEGFGCVSEQPEDETPHLAKPPCSELGEVRNLRVPDPLTDGRMPLFIEATRQVRRAVGDEVAIRTPGTGPFALASYFIGTQEWLIEIALANAGMPGSDREALHHALELSSDALIAFGKACFDAGADLLHCGDSLSSCDVISPKDYEEWAFPYQRKVITAWKEHGAKTLLHICGDSSAVLDLYVQTGADIIEVDHKVDLAYAREVVAGRCAIIGNLDPVTALLQGTPDAVAHASRRAMSVAATTPGGFILGSGCAVPRPTPFENIRAMVEAAQAFEPAAA